MRCMRLSSAAAASVNLYAVFHDILENAEFDLDGVRRVAHYGHCCWSAGQSEAIQGLRNPRIVEAESKRC